MKKKFIKLLSVILTCVAISSTSVMAATTDNVKERAEKTTGVQNGKNIEDVVKHLKKQFHEINKEDNNKKDKSNSNKKDKSNSNEIEASLWAGGDEQNKPVPLTLFGVIYYGDKSNKYEPSGKSVSRNKLPISFLTYQQGDGRIISIKIDGTVTNLYRTESIVVATDEYRRVTELEYNITFNNSLIANLSNGTHTVEVICSSRNRYTTYGNDIPGSFTFNLVD